MKKFDSWIKKVDEWHEAQRKQSEIAMKLADTELFEKAMLACDGLGDEMRLGTFDYILDAVKQKYA